MNSTLKTALPIGLVVLMIFGIAFMSQFTAPAPPTVEREEEQTGLPLIVGNAEVKHDPNPNAAPHDRFFPGNFEVGTDEKQNRVGFVVRNARPASVFLTALPPSCTACTWARGTAIPADALRSYLQHVAASPPSPFPTGDFLSAIAWAQTQPKLAWHEFAFNDVRNKLELPGATAADGEAWGIIELGFKMAAVGLPNPKHAAFDVYDARGQKLSPQPFPFTVVVGGREAQELNISDFPVPELTETITEHPFEILCVSATRANLPPPTASVGNRDPHVTLAAPVPLDARELFVISRIASTQPQSGGGTAAVNFLSGYRIAGTVRRDADGRTLDLGPYDKDVFIGAGPGIVLLKPARVRLHGNVVGAIRLEGTNKIEFGSYEGNYPQKKELRLWTERKGMELEIVPELCSPSFLKPVLAKPTNEADRTYWSLGVTIPAKEGRSPPWEGYIYLRSKGEKPLNIRIQVSGHGR